MATYHVKAPNGKTYTIDGPPGATQEQALAEVLKQEPSAGIPAVIQGERLQPDLIKASTDALGFTIGFGLAGLLLFWVLAGRLWKKKKQTPAQLGLWCGAWLAGITVLTVGGKDFHLGWQAVAMHLAVLTPVFFILGFIGGVLFKVIALLTIRKANHPQVPESVNEDVVSAGTSGPIGDAHYAAAFAEMEDGKIDRGLWARCLADADGDEAKTRACYIRLRALALSGGAVHHSS